MHNTQTHSTKTCDECHSDYHQHTSVMNGLCPNCSHLLYGYQNCEHQFSHGKCIYCGWNGNVSSFLSHTK